MKRPLLRIATLLLAASAASLPAAALVRIPSGMERTVSSGVVSDAESSAPDVVSASPASGGGLLLRAGEPGKAEVSYRKGDGALRVEQVLVLPALSQDAMAVYSLLGDIAGIEVYDASGRVVVDGKTTTVSEKGRVEAVVAAFGNKVLNLSLLDTGKSNEAIAEFIRRASGLDALSVTILGDTAYLRGPVPSETVRSNVVSLASTQISKVVDMTEVRQDMIETEVLFLRVQKTQGRNFGMNLLDGGDGLGLTGGFNGAQNYADNHWGGLQMGVNWTVSLAPKIQAIVSGGEAEVVARPRVGTRIGEKGRFLSGGEMYYKTAGEVSGDLQSVEYGIELSVAPRYLSGDRLCNDITIELSFPNQQSSTADLSLDKYTIESSVVCELGQSVILSGLTERIRNAGTDKTPVLGDIPLVNLFFSARSKDLKESELIAIITPRLLDGDLNERRQRETTEDIQSQREWLAEHDRQTLRVSQRAHASAHDAVKAEQARYEKVQEEKAAAEAKEREAAEKAAAEAEKARLAEEEKAAKLAAKEREKAEKLAREQAEAEAKERARLERIAEKERERAEEEAKARAKAEAKAREEAERLAAKERARAEKLAREKAEEEAKARAKAEKLAREKAEEEAKARAKAEKRAAEERAKAEKLAREKAEEEAKARAKAEKRAAEERAKAEKLAREKAEEEAKARAKAEKRAAEEREKAERLARKKAEEEARAAEKAARKAEKERQELIAERRRQLEKQLAERRKAEERRQKENAEIARKAEEERIRREREAAKAAERERERQEKLAKQRRAEEEAAAKEARRRAELEAKARAEHEAFLAKQRARQEAEAAKAAKEAEKAAREAAEARRRADEANAKAAAAARALRELSLPAE